MTAREQLLQELAQVSDELAEEVLDFLLFAKSRRATVASEVASASVEDEDDQPNEQILASLRRSLQDAKAGRTRPVSELWEGINVE